jgi:hypothetical protein
MTESPTTGDPAARTGSVDETDTNKGPRQTPAVPVTVTVAATHARTNEIPRIRIAAQ